MRKHVWRIALSTVLVIVVAFSWFHQLDSIAIDKVDEGFNRALASYAVARTLNAVISFAQGTELSASFVLGVTLAPGQLLDPINDLVEQFANLMLASCAAFGIMHVLITIGSFWLFSLLLTISASVWLWMFWKKTHIPNLITKVVVVLLFVRFCIPIVNFGGDFIFKQFLATEYSQNQRAIQLNSDEVERLANDDSVFMKKEGIERLKQRAEQLVENMVNLSVVFILQTLLIPLVLLWSLYKLGLGTISSIGEHRRATRAIYQA